MRVLFLAPLLASFVLFRQVASQFHPPIPKEYPALPSLREQAKIQDGWTAKRFQYIPELMQKNGVDVWLVSYYGLNLFDYHIIYSDR